MKTAPLHGTPDWHRARAAGLGGSEIAAVLGLSPWESAFSLWHKKRAILAVPPGHDLPPLRSLGQEDSERMMWGRLIEPVVADRYAQLHPQWQMLPVPLRAHPKRPWQIGSPDRILIPACDCGLHRARSCLCPPGSPCPSCTRACCDPDDCGPCCEHCPTCPTLARRREVLEIKLSDRSEDWGEEGTDQIPVYYRCQVLWYLDILGLQRARIAVLMSGHTLRHYSVEADQEDLELMRRAGQDFVQSLQDGTPPPLDGHSATLNAVKELLPGADPDAEQDVQLDPDLARAYADAVNGSARAEEEANLRRSQVLLCIGGGRRAKVGTDTIAYRQISASTGRTRALMPGHHLQRHATSPTKECPA